MKQHALQIAPSACGVWGELWNVRMWRERIWGEMWTVEMWGKKVLHLLCHCPDCGHAGERLVEELAPELTPMLASLEMPANFVPVTNAVFAEMGRRGIGRQQILTALRKMGTELPHDSVEMMQVCCSSLSAMRHPPCASPTIYLLTG